jgi:hypothetical protein
MFPCLPYICTFLDKQLYIHPHKKEKKVGQLVTLLQKQKDWVSYPCPGGVCRPQPHGSFLCLCSTASLFA